MTYWSPLRDLIEHLAICKAHIDCFEDCQLQYSVKYCDIVLFQVVNAMGSY